MSNVDFFMEKAKICKGTMGPFAFVEGLSEHASAGYGKSNLDALGLLRKKVTENAPAFVAAWEKKHGKIEAGV